MSRFPEDNLRYFSKCFFFFSYTTLTFIDSIPDARAIFVDQKILEGKKMLIDTFLNILFEIVEFFSKKKKNKAKVCSKSCLTVVTYFTLQGFHCKTEVMRKSQVFR